MKVPVITPSESVDGRYVLVDVRSPREFAQGSVPGAFNRPLLDDDARARVGGVYREQGAQPARMQAVELIASSLPSYLAELRELGRGGRLAIMCWRGGERSRNVVLLLALVGVHALQVEGGYKAYRRWVCAGLSQWQPEVPVVTLFGYTGAGKSALLRAMAVLSAELPRPRPGVLDLEELARHRGSLLGGLNQPGTRTQKDFDALLWDALRRLEADYLVLEGEGAKIGDIFLPATMAAAIRGGIPVHVWADPGARARRLLLEYAPGGWDAADHDRFRQSLDRIGRRLPAEVEHGLRVAFEDGRFGDVVRGLLEEYYDPLYLRSAVEGREFVLTLNSTRDPSADARALAAGLAPLIDRQPAPGPCSR